MKEVRDSIKLKAKKTILVMLLSFGFSCIFAQQPVIIEIGLLPENPTTDTEVRVALSLGTFNNTQYPGSNYTINNDSIFVETCITESNGPSPTMHLDTVIIGTFPIGDYVVKYTGSMTYSPDTCDAFNRNDTILYFTISEPLSLTERMKDRGLVAWPNPNSTGILNFNGALEEYSVSIRNSYGAELLSLGKEEFFGKELNISNLSEGLYFLQITHDTKGILTTRIIVE